MKQIFSALSIVITAVIALGCNHTTLKTEPVVPEQLVLINIKEFSRGELGNLIFELSALNPKVIGMGVVLRGLKDTGEDSHLARAIENSGKVILMAAVANDTLVRPEKVFSKHALAVGVNSLVIGADDVVSSYIPLFEDQSGQMDSFPSLISFYFDRAKNGRILIEQDVNALVDIKLTRTVKQFNVLKRTPLKRQEIANKIVILGYLGPKDDDLVNVKIQDKDKIHQAYQTAVTANIVYNNLE